MSVPPLVCSTPPPPDHVDEIVYNDEFSLDYEDSSPSHQYESRGYSFNDPPSVKEMSPDNITPSPYLSSPTEKVSTFQIKKDETNEDEVVRKKEEPSAAPEKLSNRTDITPQDEYKVNDISDHIIEDNGIEDLDLKLDSLQLDFQNAKESIEDTLNSTFDDFGTFLSTNAPNDSLENSIYLPIPGLTESKLEKPQKLHEISSDGSFTPPNGDNSDSEIGWENVPDSLNENTDLDISTEVPDIFFDTNVVYSDADKDLPDNVTIEIQDNANDTCQTLTDSSISNNDEFSIDTHFEVINDASGDKNLESAGHVLENSHAEISADISDNGAKNIEPETNELSLVENLDTLIDEPPKHADFVSDSLSSLNVASDVPIDVDLHSAIENLDVYGDTLGDMKTSADDDFDDFATFENTDTNLFPNNIENNAFTFNIEQANSNELDIIVDSGKSVLGNDSVEDGASQSDIDDFGDFDTYDPSCEPVQMETTELSPVSSLNSTGTMQMAEFGNSNDTEIYEKLCSVVNEIFPDENFDSVSCEDCELNAALGENWKHLKDYETEQSYLFQWNNSASQKSLLKSLGIDSRNILFGPKWNTNMPRFAANLGVSPLQPIRQISNMNAMSDYRTDDRLSNDVENPAAIASDSKENDWENATSLSTTDLQASSYAESLLLDLEHLMATLDQMTSGQSAHFKISDLFTNAIERGEEHTNIPHSCEHVTPPEQQNKQVKTPAHPTMLNIGRQINLPETHIFTPTDSETPWSHTIHYNDVEKMPSSKTDDSNSCNTLSKSEALDGIQQDTFEDFSDFKSHSGFGSVTKSSVIPDTSQYDFDFVLNEKVQNNALSTDFKDQLPKQTLPFVESSSKEIDDFGDFHSAEALKQVSQAPPTIPPAQPLHVLEPVKVIPSIPVVNWPAPGDIKSSAFEEFTDIPAVPPLQPIWDDTQTFTPAKLFSSAPTFILKESKITSECFVSDIPPEIPKMKTNTPSSEFDEFSEFQSVAEASSKTQPLGHGTSYISQTFNKEPASVSSIDLNKNISFESKSMSTVNDDFDDFQSVEFNSATTTSRETPKYTYSVQSFPRQEFVPKYHNTFQTSAASKLPSAKSLGFPVEQYSRTPLQPVSVQPSDDYATKNASHQILQPLSLESYSQINWPDPGIDLQDLSRFNPINSIQSYTEPKETKNNNSHGNVQDDDGWSDFVSIKPASQNAGKTTGFNAVSNNHPSPANVGMEDSEDWSDFVSNTVLPSRNYNEVKTISQNIHSQANSAAPYKYKGGGNVNLNPSTPKTPEMPPSVSVLPHLSYSTSKTSVNRKYNNHFQNL